MNRTTMNTTLEDVLKDDIMSEIYVEAGDDGKAVKVFGKIAGLPNVGRTFFKSNNEIIEKHEWAWAQIMQKYGDEICGGSAALKGDSPTSATAPNFNKKKANEAYGGGGESKGGLVECSVKHLMDIPSSGFKESIGVGTVEQAWKEFQNFVADKSKDEKWKSAHEKDFQEMNKLMQGMNWKTGPGDKQNLDKWNGVVKKLSGDNWKGQMSSDEGLRAKIDSLWASWKKWQKDNGITPSAGGMFDNVSIPEDDSWIPERAYRIDVTTNFDENWYKRKFKSGLLNKLITGLKNQAMSYSTAEIKQKYGDKKYDAEEMTDADKRKLDGIKWKMTNKIASDYITYLLGWKRKKEYVVKEGNEKDAASPMEQDAGLGKKFADKALKNRGLISRMKQKVFAGGQNSNVISVAFQPADWRDGWKLVESNNGVEGVDGSEGEGEEGGKDGKDGGSGSDGKGGSGGGGGAGSGKGGAGPGSGADGKSGSGMSLLQRVVKIEDKMIDNDMWGDIPHPPRTKNKYDDDKKQTMVKESNEDPFVGVFGSIDEGRVSLVSEACLSGDSIDELIFDCVLA